MKNRWLALVLVVVLCLSLLPMQVLASGNPDIEETQRVCRSYWEFVDALNTPTVETIMIWPKWEIIHNSGEYEYFSWPTEDVELVINADGWPDIFIHEPFTIPENVTVRSYKPINIGGNLTVNGDWYSMSNQANISGSGSTVTFNGDVYMNGANSGFRNTQKNVFNRNLQINANNVSIKNMVLGNGAKVTGKEFYVWNSLSCPTGSATVESKLCCQYNKSITGSLPIVTLSGNLKLGNVRTSYSGLVVDSNSRVVMDDLYISPDEGTTLEVKEDAHLTINEFTFYDPKVLVTVAGTLELTGEGTQATQNEFRMNGGTMILRPNVHLNTTNNTGFISGTGELRLYAESAENGIVRGAAILYGYSTNFEDDFEDLLNSGKISSDVTIWRSWEDCLHKDVLVADGAVPIAPTCGMEGYTPGTCQECGLLQKIDPVPPTWNHELTVNKTISERETDTWKRITTEIMHKCDACKYVSYFTETSYIYNTGEIEEWITLTVNRLTEGDCVAAALYDEHGKFLGITRGKAEDQGIFLEVQKPQQEDPSKVKIFVTNDGWSANRPVEEFALVGDD